MKLLLCTPAYGGLMYADFVGCLLDSLRYCHSVGITAEVYFLGNHSDIGGARNICAAYAMSRGFDKLLFLDADQTWRPEELGYLLNSKRSIVGGVYSKKTIPLDMNFTPLPEHKAKYFPDSGKSVEQFRAYAEAEADEAGEIEVEHLATGFLLIDCAVFAALKPGCPTYLLKANQHAEEQRNWDFFPMGVLNGVRLTEDYFFCSQARAAGHIPYLNTAAMPGHIGSFNYQVPRALRPEAK